MMDRARLSDRLKSYRLTWTDKDLQVLIEQRLRFFSKNKARPYTRLAELSDIDDLDNRLIKVAQGNPRTLITLCDYLISEHCRMPITDDHLQLIQQDLDNALRRLTETRSNEQGGARLSYSPIDSLPTPIAVLVAHYREEQNATQKLWHAFGLTQTVLQFVACALLVLYKRCGQTDSELDEKLRRLLFTVENPPSLGDWRQVVDRILKKKDTITSELIESFVQFRSGKDVGQCINGLIESRNAAAHSRLGVPETRKLSEIDDYLDKLLAALEPVSRVQLVSVEGHDVAQSGKIIHSVRVHKGNILVPERQDILFQSNYRRGRVVLHDHASQTDADLWPFLVFEMVSEQTMTEAECAICVYDQIVDPQHTRQFEVQYVNPISGQTFRSSSPIPDLKDMGLILQ